MDQVKNPLKSLQNSLNPLPALAGTSMIYGI